MRHSSPPILKNVLPSKNNNSKTSVETLAELYVFFFAFRVERSNSVEILSAKKKIRYANLPLADYF